MVSTLIVPLPEEAVLLAAGWFSHAGTFAFPVAFLVCWAAVMTGDLASYLIGRFLLERLLRTRLGKRVVKDDQRRWAEDLVRRNNIKAIVLGRFLVALRGPVYFAVGAARVKPLRFALVDGLVGLIEIALVMALGWFFGDSEDLSGHVKWLLIGVGATFAVTLAAPLVWRRVTQAQAV